MKYQIILHFQIAITVLAIASCNTRNRVNERSVTLKDSHIILDSQYSSLLKCYEGDKIIDSTIFLGFKLGMSFREFEYHLTELIKQKEIIHQSNNLYHFIKYKEYSDKDKDNSHHFVTELSFEVDEKNKSLKGVLVTLYGPRFYIPSTFQRGDFTDANLAETAERIHRESLNIIPKSKEYAPRIERVISEGILDLYRKKYGNENHIVKDYMISKTEYLWINSSKLIKLLLRNDYEQMAIEYMNRDVPASKEEISGLIELGKVIYTSIETEIKDNEGIHELGRDLHVYMDSIYRKNQEDEKIMEVQRANASGI